MTSASKHMFRGVFDECCARHSKSFRLRFGQFAPWRAGKCRAYAERRAVRVRTVHFKATESTFVCLPGSAEPFAVALLDVTDAGVNDPSPGLLFLRCRQPGQHLVENKKGHLVIAVLFSVPGDGDRSRCQGGHEVTKRKLSIGLFEASVPPSVGVRQDQAA